MTFIDPTKPETIEAALAQMNAQRARELATEPRPDYAVLRGHDVVRSLIHDVGADHAIQVIQCVEQFGADRVKRWIVNLSALEGLPCEGGR